MNILDHHFCDLSTIQAVRLFQLRSEVFVVEQNCVYQDLDGRDEEPQTRHLWIEQAGRPVVALRLLEDKDCRRVGRLVTDAEHRGQGLAGTLLNYCLAHSIGPWVLSAQCQLESWYTSFGFRRSGDDYLEDGIPHLPMRRTRR